MTDQEKQQIAADPCRRTLVAEEPNNNQIDKVFRGEPTTLVIITPTKQIWRHEWKAEQAARLAEGYGGK